MVEGYTRAPLLAPWSRAAFPSRESPTKHKRALPLPQFDHATRNPTGRQAIASRPGVPPGEQTPVRREETEADPHGGRALPCFVPGTFDPPRCRYTGCRVERAVRRRLVSTGASRKRGAVSGGRDSRSGVDDPGGFSSARCPRGIGASETSSKSQAGFTARAAFPWQGRRRRGGGKERESAREPCISRPLGANAAARLAWLSARPRARRSTIDALANGRSCPDAGAAD